MLGTILIGLAAARSPHGFRAVGIIALIVFVAVLVLNVP
jgi:hypothetical protein